MDKLKRNSGPRPTNPSQPPQEVLGPGREPLFRETAPARIARSLYQHRMLLIGLFCLRASRPPGDEPPGRDEKADKAGHRKTAARSPETDREAFLRWVAEHMLAGAREQITREDGADHV